MGNKIEGHSLTCPCCGGDANISVTKHNTIFTWCKNVIDEETGEFCGYRGFLGKSQSRKILAEINKEEITNVQPKEEKPSAGEPAGGNDNATGGSEPEDRPEQPATEHSGSNEPAKKRAGSLAAGLKHFLTGDE